MMDKERKILDYHANRRAARVKSAILLIAACILAAWSIALLTLSGRSLIDLDTFRVRFENNATVIIHLRDVPMRDVPVGPHLWRSVPLLLCEYGSGFAPMGLGRYKTLPFIRTFTVYSPTVHCATLAIVGWLIWIARAGRLH